MEANSSANLTFFIPSETGQSVCRRGESYHSLQAWSDLFHWSRTKTRYFFMKLQGSGLIEMENRTNTTRIRVIHYDFSVGLASEGKAQVYPDDFEVFWNYL
jgi:hypothetical protein